MNIKLKRILRTEHNDHSICMMYDGKWVCLKSWLESSDFQSEEMKVLHDSCSDMIEFLKNRHIFEKELYHQLTESVIDDSKLNQEYKDVIPFRPIQYRDFMLSEDHVINSSRSFVKLMMPKLWPIVSGYEKITGKPFPKLKPSKSWYDNPIYYKGSVMSFVTDNDMVEYPEYATVRDYELELGMIITKEIMNATEDEALDAIGGFCVFNDFSVRNVQLAEMTDSGFGPCKAKDFSNAISTIVVTPDEILPNMDNLSAKVIINGKVVADSKLDSFHHSIGSAVAYASKGEKVFPGEFMGTGTIPNCCGMENSHLLKSGDEIVVEIENIGQLKNYIR